jgi:hypothetical protein
MMNKISSINTHNTVLFHGLSTLIVSILNSLVVFCHNVGT